MESDSKSSAYKMVFNRDFLKTTKRERDPITGNYLEVEINKVSYEDLENFDGLNIVIKSIHPKIENGVLKSLEFEISSISSEKKSEVKRTEYSEYKYLENSGTGNKTEFEETILDEKGFSSFRERLEYNQKQKLDSFLEKIKEMGDNKIRVESDHKQHIAIKYYQGRAKAWMVIKASGKNLFLWLRVDPQSFKDDKSLTVPYDDSSKTHGNRRLDLVSSKIEDVMELVRQSYEFRKRYDFYDKYSEIVYTVKQT